jgi:hypothetical protein
MLFLEFLLLLLIILYCFRTDNYGMIILLLKEGFNPFILGIYTFLDYFLFIILKLFR